MSKSKVEEAAEKHWMDWYGGDDMLAVEAAYIAGARFILEEARKVAGHYVPTHAGPEVLSSELCISIKDLEAMFGEAKDES